MTFKEQPVVEVGRKKETIGYIPNGPITQMVTPLIGEPESFGIDTQQLTINLGFQFQNGIRSVFLLGNAGGFLFLSQDQKKQVIQTATETAPAELNLLVGISSDTLKNTIELAKFAEESGAQALVLVPCFGGSQPPQKKIQAVLDATGNIPLILYLNPDLHREDQHLSPRDMASLISQHHRLTGAKISFGTMEEFTSYTVLQSDTFHVLQGNAYLVAESTQIPGFSLTGFIPIAANDQPKVHVDFHQKRTNLFRIIQQLPHEYPNIQTTIQKMLDNGRINQETFDIYQANLK